MALPIAAANIEISVRPLFLKSPRIIICHVASSILQRDLYLSRKTAPPTGGGALRIASAGSSLVIFLTPLMVPSMANSIDTPIPLSASSG